MNRSKLEDEVVRATKVRKLKDAFLDQFFQEKEAQLFEHFKSIPIGASDDLVEIHHQLKSMNALKVAVQSVMDTGKMARIELDDTDN